MIFLMLIVSRFFKTRVYVLPFIVLNLLFFLLIVFEQTSLKVMFAS